MSMIQYTQIVISKQASKQVEAGFPWVYRSEIMLNSALEQLSPGTLIQLVNKQGKRLGIATFNPASVIAARILYLGAGSIVMDTAFFNHRFKQALEKREKWFSVPYYRLVHSEGDHLPGLVVDRFGDFLVCQTTTAGMEHLKPAWIVALKNLFNPKGIVFRDDVAVRKQEGLSLSVSYWGEEPPDPIEVLERNTRYLAHLKTGQKTGWFYDQRENRGYVAKQCAGKTMLDLYTHSGGFGLAAAVAGAASVTLVDASGLALELARQAAELNGVKERCRSVEGDIFELLPVWVQEGKRYDVVVADPPAFIKEKRSMATGLKGYEKLAYLCAGLVNPGGMFLIASCSHHAALPLFRKAVEAGMLRGGRKFTHLRTSFADKDHVIHPMLEQNSYLKALSYRLD